MKEGRWKIVLASNSPRRKELLAGLDLDFQVRIIDGIDESYPADLPTPRYHRRHHCRLGRRGYG